MKMPRWLSRMVETRYPSQDELEVERARSYIRFQCVGLSLLLGIAAYVIFGLPEFSAARKAAFIGLLSIMCCVSGAVIIYERGHLRRLRERE